MKAPISLDRAMRRPLAREVAAGILLALAGVTFLLLGSNLRLGTLAAMGPGYLPRVLSWMLIGLGLTIVAVAVLFRVSQTLDQITQRPRGRALILVVLAPVLFALLINRAGLVLTVALVALVARLASREPIGLDALVTPLLLATFCAVVFIRLLGQAIPLLP